MKALARWSLLSVFFLTTFAWSFDEFPVGARPMALSGAYNGLSDDAYTLAYNVGGLSNIRRPEVTLYYTKLFPGLTDGTNSALSYLGYVYPVGPRGRLGAVGFGYSDYQVSSLFKEQSYALGYGRNFLNNFMGSGLTLKYLDRSFGSDINTQNALIGNSPSNRSGSSDPIFGSGASAQALGLDWGLFLRPWAGTTLGLSLNNVNQPDLGLTGSEKVPMVTRVGIAHRRRFLRASVDVTHRKTINSQADDRLLLGAERTWAFYRFGEVSARGGAGFGNRDFRQGTLGLGYEINGMVVDYVFRMPLGAFDDFGNTHHVSLSFRFGKSPVAQELEEMIREEKMATQHAEESLKISEAKAAFMKSDRDRLAQELFELKKQMAGLKSTPPPPANPIDREKAERLAAEQRALAAYQADLRNYFQKAQSSTIKARIALLKGLINEHKPKGVQTDSAERELARITQIWNKAEFDFKASFEFYKKSAARGADNLERISVLERIVKKYNVYGLDMTEVNKELKLLKKSK